MTTLTYAGVGSRSTPPKVQSHMTATANLLGKMGWHLRSGGATGADQAFAWGAPRAGRTIYLPWRHFNGRSGSECVIFPPDHMRKLVRAASEHHPRWSSCNNGARKLHGRNMAVVLGPELDDPVDAVICWTPEGRTYGGTGQAIRVARKWSIPILNLGTLKDEAFTNISPQDGAHAIVRWLEKLLHLEDERKAQGRLL